MVAQVNSIDKLIMDKISTHTFFAHYLGSSSLFSSPHFLKAEKSGLLNNLRKLVQSIINVNLSDTPPTCIIYCIIYCIITQH